MENYRINPLWGKCAVFDGDSICQAGTASGGWPARIGKANAMDWYNYGIGGGTITAELYAGEGEEKKPRHWISRNIDVIHEKHPTLDYLILEGGTNDADLLGISSPSYGKLDLSDYSGNYDEKTFTGALEALFYKAITYYPKAKIGFIIAKKMGVRPIGYGKDNKRRYYFLRAIEVCKKWGIPYIDLWDESPVNPSLKCYFDPDLSKEENFKNGKAYEDGQHLNDIGFDIISPAIEAWMMTL